RGSSCSLPCWVLSPGPDRTWLGLEGGMLCQLIRSPDYNLFPNSAVFESNFIQVTKKGKWMDITHTPTIVTLAVTSSDPCLPLPNVLLMANQQAPLQRGTLGSLTASVALPRLLPLRYVRLSVHSASQRILRLQTVTKTVYYLQLHHKYPEAVFALWSRLTNILENGLSTTTKDPAIPIRHCLVSSRSSSTSSISPLVETQILQLFFISQRCFSLFLSRGNWTFWLFSEDLSLLIQGASEWIVVEEAPWIRSQVSSEKSQKVQVPLERDKEKHLWHNHDLDDRISTEHSSYVFVSRPLII
uniref:Golgi associated RAB2 interactor 1A n=1 Tax=Naja naja TaxID=35670 RepID=A0A8C6YG59_NAJNA